MFAVLLLLAALVSAGWSAPPPDPCDQPYAAALEAYQAAGERTEAIHHALTLSEQARRCLGEANAGRLQTLYIQEVELLYRLRDYPVLVRRADEFLAAVGPDAVQSYSVYRHRGYAQYMLNNLSAAAGDFAQALALAETAPGIERVRLLLSLGATAQRMRDFHSATDAYEQAIQLLDSLDRATPRWDWYRVYSLNAQADLLVEKADLNLAPFEPQLRRAAELLEESMALLRKGPPDTRTAYALTLLGDVYTELHQEEKALGYFQRAYDLAWQLDDGHWHYAATYKLGIYYMRTAQFDRAQTLLLKAHSLVGAARSIDFERRVLRDLGRLYELRGEYARAESFFDQAIAVTERFRQSLRTTTWSSGAFTEWRRSYRGRTRVLLAQGRFEDAFLALEQTRARHLHDMRTQAQLLGRLSLAARARFDSLTTALAETMSALADDALPVARRNALRSQQARLMAQRRILLDLDEHFPPPSIAALQQTLARRGQVLMSYFIDRSQRWSSVLKRPARSYAFLLTPDTLHAFPLPASAQDVAALLEQVSPVLTAGQEAVRFNTMLYALPVLKRLYDLLFAPAAAHVPAGARLVVIPDGPLFLLPFGMLIEEETDPYAYQTAPYLVRKHAISVELAASLLLAEAAAEAPRAAYDVVAFGKTSFSGVRRTMTVRDAETADAALIDLPAVVDEIRAIRRLFRKTQTRLDAEATESAFLDLAPRAKILHLASHTRLDDASPLQNAVLLSADADDSGHDGRLFVHEIQRQALAARLVVLSGCNTARGVLQSGEGMAGLQYAFRAMGVESSLATSWFAEDAASVRLIDGFYRHLRRGLPKDVALQHAQLAFLEGATRTTASPFFWAAPVFYGDAAPLRFAPDWRLRTFWLALLVGGLFFAFFLWRRAHRRLLPNPAA